MTHDEVLAMLRKILAEHLGVDPDSVTMEATYQEDLGADSLDLVELVMELEDQFNLKISDEEAQAMITVGDTVNYIVDHTT